MKKMTKGAIVTGLGVALLLGGGGTLAVWNADATSDAGSVVAGNLELTAKPGVWTDSTGAVIKSIGGYEVVPGEKLTYTQKVTPTLEGDKIAATLKVTGADKIMAHNDSKFITVTAPVLTSDKGVVQPDTVLDEGDHNKQVTASTTFAFSKDVLKDEYMNHEWDFSGIGYYMEQKAPGATPTN